MEPPPAAPRRTGLIVALLVVALLVIGGIVGVVLVVGRGAPELELTIDTCEIAADGTLSATGSVRAGGDAADVDVDVTFSDVATDATVDDDSTQVAVPADAAGRWTAAGTAGDTVQQVTCDATADD